MTEISNHRLEKNGVHECVKIATISKRGVLYDGQYKSQQIGSLPIGYQVLSYQLYNSSYSTERITSHVTHVPIPPVACLSRHVLPTVASYLPSRPTPVMPPTPTIPPIPPHVPHILSRATYHLSGPTPRHVINPSCPPTTSRPRNLVTSFYSCHCPRPSIHVASPQLRHFSLPTVTSLYSCQVSLNHLSRPSSPVTSPYHLSRPPTTCHVFQLPSRLPTTRHVL